MVVKMLAITAVTAVTAAPAAFAQATGDPVSVSPDDLNIRYEGHWAVTPAAATTVNSGSRAFVRFTGRHLSATFDTTSITNPAQLYVRIDDGPKTLVRVGQRTIDLASAGLSEGAHSAELVVKDVDERANRWVPPLRSGLILTGFRLDPEATTLPAAQPVGPRLLFLGDSITQGVRALGAQPGPNGSDATRAYPSVVAEEFKAQLAQVGFGSQGIVAAGGGSVPNARAAFGLNFQGSPADPSFVPDAVVINQGTNDTSASAATFRPAYASYLRQVRAAYPQAWIFAMRPFNGTHADDVAGAVADVADGRVVFLDTTGWLERYDYNDSLHPTIAGHERVAQRLATAIAARTGWTAPDSTPSSAHLLADFENDSAGGWEPGDYVGAIAPTSAIPTGGSAPYDGATALAITSNAAPYTEWRTVTYRPAQPLRLPARASELFAFVSVARSTAPFNDIKVTIRGPGGERTTANADLSGTSLPWNRVVADLTGWAGPITQVVISVRGQGSATAGALSFQVDDLGYVEQGSPAGAPVTSTDTGSVSAVVPSALALTLGAPVTFAPFTPGLTRDYAASTTATVDSTAGDATLTVADPDRNGRLANGAFALPSPLRARATSAAGAGRPMTALGDQPVALLEYDGPVSHDLVTLDFQQHIGGDDPLRTGVYAKTLTFTVSTTTP